MVSRIWALSFACVALVGLLVLSTSAAESMSGTIEKAGSGEISIKDDAGAIQTFAVASSAKIMIDGKDTKLDDLPAGATATVTTENVGNKSLAVMIVARSKL